MTETQPQTVHFEGGQLVLHDGQPYFRMAFYGIFRKDIYGDRLHGIKVSESQEMERYAMFLVGGRLAMTVGTGQPEDHVVVDVIDVPKSVILESVDYTEHHPDWYVRTWLPNSLGGVWCYLMPVERMMEARGVKVPHGDYLKALDER
jgi:gamma-glutamylcyclotransferase (GGCT)/AIG2-like uncharacterized protein YtfP